MKIISKVLFFVWICVGGVALEVPLPLQRGDTVAIVAPGKPGNRSEVERCVRALNEKGYNVWLAPNLFKRRGYLAGTDNERAQSMMQAWRNPYIKAIWCIAGGYGTTRILNDLDYDYIAKHPKIFVGMSDVTALHSALNRKANIVTFLGPTLSQLYGKGVANVNSERSAWDSIEKTTRGEGLSYSSDNLKVICPGYCRGKLTGGTLSLVAALMGTPYQIDTRNRILILEDVNEEPYRVDRMLRQLKQGGLFDRPAGVILCSWKGCKSKYPPGSLTLDQVFNDYFADASYPVVKGFPSGHIDEQLTLPLGALAELDTSGLKLIIQ